MKFPVGHLELGYTRVMAATAPESYEPIKPDPIATTRQAIDEILPARADFAAKSISRPAALVALFDGRASFGAINSWRYRGKTPAWALSILIEHLERRAKHCLELASRLRSL